MAASGGTDEAAKLSRRGTSTRSLAGRSEANQGASGILAKLHRAVMATGTAVVRIREGGRANRIATVDPANASIGNAKDFSEGAPARPEVARKTLGAWKATLPAVHGIAPGVDARLDAGVGGAEHLSHLRTCATSPAAGLEASHADVATDAAVEVIPRHLGADRAGVRLAEGLPRLVTDAFASEAG